MAQNTALNAEIASRIRDEAHRASVTHRDLATRIGIPDRTLARLLAGQSDWKIAEVDRIAGTLGVELTALLPSAVTR